MNVNKYSKTLTKLVIVICIMQMIQSCISTEKPSSEFLRLMNKSRTLSENRINFNGGYHQLTNHAFNIPTEYKNGKPTKTIDTAYLQSPVFFFENGLMFLNQSMFADSTEFTSWMTQYGQQKYTSNKWGVYEIVNDTIRVILYMDWQSKSRIIPNRLLLTHFQGIIKDKDKIMQWQMAPPYPLIAESYHLNEPKLERLTKPRDIGLKTIKIENLVNPDKAWIRELRPKD